MHTDENLVRINDKIDELKISLDPLKVQAETAKKYLLLRDELRSLEVSVWMETLDRLHERAKTVNDGLGKCKKWTRAGTIRAKRALLGIRKLFRENA